MYGKILVTLVAVMFMGGLLSGCGGEKEDVAPTSSATVAQSTEQPSEEQGALTQESKEGKVSSDGVDYFEKFGIRDNGDSITFMDDLNEEVTLKKKPERVANLYNSYLELWTVMGGDVTAIIKQNEGKPIEGVNPDATVVGELGSINTELLVSLNPDLVLVSPIMKGAELAKNLKSMNIPVLYLDLDNREDYIREVRIFSALLDDEGAFEKYAIQLNGDIENIIEKVPTDNPPTVLLMNSMSRGVSVRDSSSQTGEIIKDLKAINIADDGKLPGDVESFSLEKIVEIDPDVILVIEMGSNTKKVAEKRKALVEDDPVWSSLKAVKNGRYHILSKDLFTYKPNQRYPEAYEVMAKYLYPDAFGGN